MLYLWLGARRPMAQSYDSSSVSRYYLGWPLHLLRGNSTCKNLPCKAQRPKCCLYETPYYVAAPVRETGVVIMHLQEPEFFGSWVMRFSRDPSCYSPGSYISFHKEATCESSNFKGLLYAHENPNSCSKIWHPSGLTLRRMPYGRGTLRIPLRRIL